MSAPFREEAREWGPIVRIDPGGVRRSSGLGNGCFSVVKSRVFRCLDSSTNDEVQHARRPPPVDDRLSDLGVGSAFPILLFTRPSVAMIGRLKQHGDQMLELP